MNDERSVVHNRRMNKNDQQRADRVDHLVEICKERGITSRQLYPVLEEVLGSSGFIGKDFGNELKSSGLSAILLYLDKALGTSRLQRRLQTLGGILDAIGLHGTTSAEEIQRDIGDAHHDGSYDW